jgi:uncharacterized membrane protein
MTVTLIYQVIAATIGFGLIGGSEIAMITVAASTQYTWKRAWLITFAGLITFIPILFAMYFFFTILPTTLTELVAGGIIFVLGANFFYKGIRKRVSGESEEQEEKLGVGQTGVYAAILLEEAELSAIVMSIGAATGGSYVYAVLGLAIGVFVPLVTIRLIRPLIEKVPEWALQMAVGAIMMAVASLIIIFHF